MKSIQKIGLLIAIVLAAGGAGVWSELQAVPPSNTAGRETAFQSADFNSFVLLAENGDGTAVVFVHAALADGTELHSFSFASTAYSISNDLQPGQSGTGRFSGTSHFTQDGEIFDPSTGTFTAVTISGDVTVTNADNVSASNNHGIFPITDPFSGETHMARQHSIGNQAYGFTAGSISLSVAGVVVKQAAGEYGEVSTFRSRLIERIR